MSSSDEEKQYASIHLRELIEKFQDEHGATVALATIGLAAVKIVRENNFQQVNLTSSPT